jgi:protein-S-isoprenylcysteine O-methyltransferase Ste14
MPKRKVPEPSESLVLAFLKIVFSLAAILALLLIFAWRMDYRQAYAYTLANAVVLGVTLIVLRDKPELMNERSKPGPGMKDWDKIYYSVSTPLYILLLFISALDAGRFGWSGDLPFAIVTLFYLLYFAGQGLFLWAKHANPFLSPVVRIQKERGQKVVETGPYRFIRHPSYLGGIIFTLSMPAMLGSWWALIPAVLSCIALVFRTKLEDDTLQKELRGYVKYTEKVRYRLLPRVW